MDLTEAENVKKGWQEYTKLYKKKKKEKNNRMGKTRDLFNKIRDTKGTFHEKMGTIKDRNGINLAQKQKALRSCKNTQKNYTKNLHDPYNQDGVITQLEPAIPECKVEWAIGSITTDKASGGDGIPVELVQILKDDAVKVLHSIC